MRGVRSGGGLTLGLVVAASACAHSVTSVSDPLDERDAGTASASTSAPTDTSASAPPPVSGSSSGADVGTYDAGRRPDAEAGVDSGGVIDAKADAGAGVYEASVPCTAQSCSNGCCDSIGLCAVMQDTACGTGGGACLDCTLTGGRCNAGSCNSSGSSSSSDAGRDAGGGLLSGCTPLTCLFGCCKGNTCMFLSSDTACGTFGAACQDCTANHKTCSLGTCN